MIKSFTSERKYGVKTTVQYESSILKAKTIIYYMQQQNVAIFLAIA